MTAKGTPKNHKPDKAKRSSRSSDSTRTLKKRPKRQENKRLTFREQWEKAEASFLNFKQNHHFSLTGNAAFNDLLERCGEAYFNVIVQEGGQWQTLTGHATPPRELLLLYNDPETIVGLRFNSMTSLLRLDIDTTSVYFPDCDRAAYNRILETMESIGLCRYSVIQSSDSGGIHVYFALPEAVPTFQAAHTLHVFLTLAGFTIQKGQLELFPNRKSYREDDIVDYQGIRLPLQSGSFVLDPFDLSPLHADLTAFMATLGVDAAHQDWDAFKRAMKIAYEDYFVNTYGLVGKRQTSGKGVEAFIKGLLAQVEPGWTGYGQTNDLIPQAIKLAIVAWGIEDDAEIITKVRDYLKSRPGYHEYCRHQHNLEQRIRDWLKTVRKFNYYKAGPWRERNAPNYSDTVRELVATEDKRRHNPANAAREQASRQRLADTIRVLRTHIRQGLFTPPQTVTGWIKLIITTAKSLLGQGFSVQFLYQCQGVLARLKAFAARFFAHPVYQDAYLVEVAPSEPEVKDITSEPVVQPSLKILEPAPKKALLAVSKESTQQEIAEIPLLPAITGYSPIYEGWGGVFQPSQGAALEQVVSADNCFSEPCVVCAEVESQPCTVLVPSSDISALPQFPFHLGEKIRFQNETFDGWRKGTIIKINFQRGYFISCLIKFYIYKRGEFVQKIAQINNERWIKPLFDST